MMTEASGAFYGVGTANRGINCYDGPNGYPQLGLSLQRNNSLFGKSSTVQPASAQTLIIIKS